MFSSAQNGLDSLKAITKSNAHDTVKLTAYTAIINIYWKTDLKQALYYSKANLTQSLKFKSEKFIATAYHCLAGTYYFMGDYPNALLYNFRALNIRQKKQKDGTTVGSKKSIASSYNNIASIYSNLGNYPKSIESNLKALKLKEEINDSIGIARAYSNIGNVYEKIHNYDQSIKFQDQALKMMIKLKNDYGIAASYNNLGNVLLKINNYKKAKSNFEKAIEIRQRINDEEGLNTTYNNMGEMYFEQKDYAEAKKYFEQAWIYYSQSQDPYLKTSILINLGEIYKNTNEQKKAEENLSQAIEIAKKNKLPEIEKSGYDCLASLFFKLKQFDKAYSNLKKYNEINDTIYKIENSKKLAELQALYDDAHKSNQIEVYKKEKIQSELESSNKALELQKQKNFKNLFLVGIIVLFVLGFMLYNRYAIKNKLNQQLEIQNQHIAEKNEDITNSINYAKRIQNAILPPKRLVKEIFKESFILYKPKDIVAGDFYWMEQVNNTVLFAAADCTGHGVPGALVSVVCNNALNRSVREYGIVEPGKILDKTKELVIAEFEKSEEEVMDGMDISLCALDLKTKQLLWAGANNPIWIVRDGELIENKGDKQPIGKFEQAKPFTTQKIELKTNDCIYIFTDGYQDQFGGEAAKKFKASRFKELLITINKNTMEEQIRLIDETFYAWKGKLEQVDDVCVIGIRL
ncbi:MAG: tetratricopeptide repeat protein [Bacteroidia bacterium]